MPKQMVETNTASQKPLFWGVLVCTIGALFYCYEFILRIIPGALQNELSAAFGHISASSFGQLSAFYYFAYSPMQLPVGMLMDRFGARRLLLFACLCCTIGSLFFDGSYSLAIASCGRFLVGFGSSFAFIGVLSLAMRWLPLQYFSLIAGLVTTLGMLGLVYGEMEITTMVSTMGLQHVLSMTVIAGVFITVLVFLFVQDGEGKSFPQTQLLSIFFHKVLQVFTKREVWLIGLVGACLYTSLSVFGELWGKTYLEQAHHLTKLEAAQTISIMFLGWALGAPIAGYFSDQSRRRVLPLVIGAILSLLCISIVLYVPGLSYLTLNVLLFFYGVFSATEIIVFVMAKENSGAELSGTVFAAVNMIVTLGGVIFQPLVGKILDRSGTPMLIEGHHVYTTFGYQMALSILPISLIIVVILAFFLKDHRQFSSKNVDEFT